MKKSESIRLVAMLFAYYPNRDEVADETIDLWAQGIRDYEAEDAMEAAHILGTSGKWTPALSEFIDAIKDCRNVRLTREPRTMLPAPSPGSLRYAACPVDDEGFPSEFPVGGAMTIGEFLASRPDMAERAAKLGWWGKSLKRLSDA